MKIIGLILFVMWLFSYFKFKRNLGYFKVMKECTTECLRKDPSSFQLKLSLASTLCELQRYKDAYDIFNETYSDVRVAANKNLIRMNMEFCKSPIPGASLRNHNGSWILFFLLKYVGRRRCSFITEEDVIRTNAEIRMRKA